LCVAEKSSSYITKVDIVFVVDLSESINEYDSMTGTNHILTMLKTCENELYNMMTGALLKRVINNLGCFKKHGIYVWTKLYISYILSNIQCKCDTECDIQRRRHHHQQQQQ